jgi:hypothetical protein
VTPDEWVVGSDAALVVGMPDVVYHADPVPGGSLSHSGAKVLLPPGSPAQYHHERLHPPADKKVFAFGRAAHRMVLGEGADWVEVKADDWTTKAAQRAAALAEFDGKTALLSKQVRVIEDMAEALAANTLAVDLLTRPGAAEVALFARDTRSGVMLRGKLDKLPDPVRGETIGVDYTTAARADPDDFARAAWRYRYYMQEPWYSDLVRAVGFADRLAFLFVVQCKEPPYLSFVGQLPADAVRYGRVRNREAVDLYAQCEAEDCWPGPADDEIVQLEMPGWAYREMEEVL